MHVIVVRSLLGMDARLRAIYNGMMDKLKAGDINGGLDNMTGTMREKYEPLLISYGGSLASIVDQIGTIAGGGIMGSVAEYVIVRDEGGQQVAFFVYFVRGSDGIWRIGEM